MVTLPICLALVGCISSLGGRRAVKMRRSYACKMAFQLATLLTVDRWLRARIIGSYRGLQRETLWLLV